MSAELIKLEKKSHFPKNLSEAIDALSEALLIENEDAKLAAVKTVLDDAIKKGLDIKDIFTKRETEKDTAVIEIVGRNSSDTLLKLCAGYYLYGTYDERRNYLSIEDKIRFVEAALEPHPAADDEGSDYERSDDEDDKRRPKTAAEAWALPPPETKILSLAGNCINHRYGLFGMSRFLLNTADLEAALGADRTRIALFCSDIPPFYFHGGDQAEAEAIAAFTFLIESILRYAQERGYKEQQDYVACRREIFTALYGMGDDLLPLLRRIYDEMQVPMSVLVAVSPRHPLTAALNCPAINRVGMVRQLCEWGVDINTVPEIEHIIREYSDIPLLAVVLAYGADVRRFQSERIEDMRLDVDGVTVQFSGEAISLLRPAIDGPVGNEDLFSAMRLWFRYGVIDRKFGLAACEKWQEAIEQQKQDCLLDGARRTVTAVPVQAQRDTTFSTSPLPPYWDPSTIERDLFEEKLQRCVKVQALCNQEAIWPHMSTDVAALDEMINAAGDMKEDALEILDQLARRYVHGEEAYELTYVEKLRLTRRLLERARSPSVAAAGAASCDVFVPTDFSVRSAGTAHYIDFIQYGWFTALHYLLSSRDWQLGMRMLQAEAEAESEVSIGRYCEVIEKASKQGNKAIVVSLLNILLQRLERKLSNAGKRSTWEEAPFWHSEGRQRRREYDDAEKQDNKHTLFLTVGLVGNVRLLHELQRIVGPIVALSVAPITRLTNLERRAERGRMYRFLLAFASTTRREMFVAFVRNNSDLLKDQELYKDLCRGLEGRLLFPQCATHSSEKRQVLRGVGKEKELYENAGWVRKKFAEGGAARDAVVQQREEQLAILMLLRKTVWSPETHAQCPAVVRERLLTGLLLSGKRVVPARAEGGARPEARESEGYCPDTWFKFPLELFCEQAVRVTGSEVLADVIPHEPPPRLVPTMEINPAAVLLLQEPTPPQAPGRDGMFAGGAAADGGAPTAGPPV